MVEECKLYKYRWIILVIFCLYAAINFIQFLHYSIISNISREYYNVDGILIDLTGLIYFICYIIFCLPFNHLIEKYNLRIISIVSSGLTTTGTVVKLLSTSRDRFYLVLIGQTLCAIGQVFIMSMPSKLASTWFGPDEVSTACAIAIFGIQIGVSVGAIMPSFFVENSDRYEDIGDGFMEMMIINASITVAIFILVLIFFRAKPKLHPSYSKSIIQNQDPSIVENLKAIFKSRNYWLLVIVFGNSNGIYLSLGIICNDVYIHYFPGCEQEIGILYATINIAGGCIGSVIFGYILDRWHLFKLTSFGIIFLSSISYIFVALSMELNSHLATQVTLPIFGFFLGSTLLVGFEFATEIMYPTPEVASCSVLNAFMYLFAIIYTFIFNVLFDSIGYIGTHCVITVLLLLSSSVMYFVQPTLRRREANVATTK